MKLPKTFKNEKDIRQLLHAVAEQMGYHVSHIESPITSSGIPDLLLSRNNADLWIETKVWSRGIHMRPPQRKWHRDRANSGGESFFVCWIGGKLYAHYGSAAIDYLPKDPKWTSAEAFNLDNTDNLIRMLVTM